MSFKVERGIIALENRLQRAKQGFDSFDGLSQSPALLVLSLMLLEARKSLRVVRGRSTGRRYFVNSKGTVYSILLALTTIQPFPEVAGNVAATNP